jgi:ribonuclease P protein component
LVRATGRSLRTDAFGARIRPTSESSVRIAVVAPRSVGTAVMRNRARRRVREAFRHAVSERRAAPGLDVLVTVQPAALTRGFGALREDAAETLAEAAK